MPGEIHGQYSQRGHKESETTKGLTLFHFQEHRGFESLFSKSPALCILKSEIWVLVITSNVYNPKWNNKCPEKACIMTLEYVYTCVVLLYI